MRPLSGQIICLAQAHLRRQQAADTATVDALLNLANRAQRIEAELDSIERSANGIAGDGYATENRRLSLVD